MGSSPDDADAPSRRAHQLRIMFAAALVTRRLTAAFAARARQSARTQARWFALYHIANVPEGISHVDLAERLNVQGPTLTRLVDALAAERLVERRDDPLDRRITRIFIRPPGLEIVRQAEGIASGLRDEAFAGISEEELAVALRVLGLAADRLAPSKPAPAPKVRPTLNKSRVPGR